MSSLDYAYCSWHWHFGSPYLFVQESSTEVTDTTYLNKNNYYNGDLYEGYSVPNLSVYSAMSYTGTAFISDNTYKGIALYNGLTSNNYISSFNTPDGHNPGNSTQVQSFRDPEYGTNETLGVGNYYKVSNNKNFMIRDRGLSDGIDFLHIHPKSFINLYIDDYFIYWETRYLYDKGSEIPDSDIDDLVSEMYYGTTTQMPKNFDHFQRIPVDFDNDLDTGTAYTFEFKTQAGSDRSIELIGGDVDEDREPIPIQGDNKKKLDFYNMNNTQAVIGNNFKIGTGDADASNYYFQYSSIKNTSIPFDEFNHIKIYNASEQDLEIKDKNDNLIGTVTTTGQIWNSKSITTGLISSLPIKIYLGEELKYEIIGMCFPPFTLVETDTGLRQIGDLKKGDLVKTSKGLIPLTKNVITNTPSGAKYVKFPKSFFSKNVPERDLYVTGFHPFSLGFKEGTDDVYNGLEAKAFLGNMEGIEEVHLDTKTYHNLIFYDMEEFSAEGMKVYSHHPNGFPYKLPENEYLNEVNKEERKLNLITWNDFIKNKPDDVELKKFIADKLKF